MSFNEMRKESWPDIHSGDLTKVCWAPQCLNTIRFSFMEIYSGLLIPLFAALNPISPLKYFTLNCKLKLFQAPLQHQLLYYYHSSAVKFRADIFTTIINTNFHIVSAKDFALI